MPSSTVVLVAALVAAGTMADGKTAVVGALTAVTAVGAAQLLTLVGVALQ